MQFERFFVLLHSVLVGLVDGRSALLFAKTASRTAVHAHLYTVGSRKPITSIYGGKTVVAALGRIAADEGVFFEGEKKTEMVPNVFAPRRFVGECSLVGIEKAMPLLALPATAFQTVGIVLCGFFVLVFGRGFRRPQRNGGLGAVAGKYRCEEKKQ